MIWFVLVFAAIALVVLVGVLVGVLAFAGAFVRLAVLRERPTSPPPEPIDDAVLARLLVLRAFLVGRHAGRRHENRLRSVAVIRLEDPVLPAATAPKDALFRGVFYALVLEEFDRRTGQVSKRRPAKKLGGRLGAHDPYPLYLAMVAATTTPGEPVAARPWARNAYVADDPAAATEALGLTSEDVARYRRFLMELPLPRWR